MSAPGASTSRARPATSGSAPAVVTWAAIHQLLVEVCESLALVVRLLIIPLLIMQIVSPLRLKDSASRLVFKKGFRLSRIGLSKN
jgi:hypothetical protein